MADILLRHDLHPAGRRYLLRDQGYRRDPYEITLLEWSPDGKQYRARHGSGELWRDNAYPIVLHELPLPIPPKPEFHINIDIVFVRDGAHAPALPAHPDDVGWDLKWDGYHLSSLPDQDARRTAIIPIHGSMTFNLGFAMEIASGYWVEIKDRSSMGKRGLHVLGGVIDASYRGPICVVLANLSDIPAEIEPDTRIAQMILHRVVPCSVTTRTDGALTWTARGTGGFGSTGA